MSKKKIDQATFGGGCFWCVEAVFQELRGVEKVVSGYAGGHDPHPTYNSVCRGVTGHAEVIQISFNPAEINFEALLEVFWHVHDPTTLNRQGADAGSQYRSIILYHDDAQRKAAEASKAKTDATGLWDDPIVTEIAALEKFFPGETHHQNYYKENPGQMYCNYVIAPKMRKFYKDFQHLLREGAQG